VTPETVFVGVVSVFYLAAVVVLIKPEWFS